MEYYLSRGSALGIFENGGLAAYCLFAHHKHHVRVIHLCVAAMARGCGHARNLVNAVESDAKSRGLGGIKLNCRRDFPANAMWPKLDFTPLAEKDAKTSGASLVTWFRGNLRGSQRDLFVEVTNERVNAVIDAQLVFQLQGEVDEVARGLRADFLADLLVLHVAAETFNEIDRAKSADQRRHSRDYALTFPQVRHDVNSMSVVEQDLRQILPSATESQISDIRQVAMTSASTVNVFLTRDEGILGRATEIRSLASVEVMSPYQMIVRLAELAERESYGALPVSGMNLSWRKVGEGDVPSMAVVTLLGPHERKGAVKVRLDEVLSNPGIWRTEGLWLDGALVAVRSARREQQRRRLVVAVCRACRGGRREFFTEYAIASLVHEAVRLGYSIVQLERDSITPEAVDGATRLGFIPTVEGLVRDCPAETMLLPALRASVRPRHQGTAARALERACSPVVLEDGDRPCLMVPIKPGYARSLFDTNLAAGDMFGANNSALLRFENVYFRRSSHRHMIQAPARILWYVSGRMGVVAVSHLDDVQIGSPKEVFRDNRRLGVLRWPEISEMCRGDRPQEIMVLRFSHTYLFRSPVDWDSVQRVYAERDSRPVVQSPSKVPREVFLGIYRLGFPVS